MNMPRPAASVLILTIVALCLLTMTTVGLSLAANHWSLSYWRHIASGRGSRPALPAERHRRAAIWFAADAVGNQDVAAAQEYVKGTSRPDDPLLVRVIGWALLLDGAQQEALHTWREVGDYRSLAEVAATFEHEGRTEDTYRALRAAQIVSPQIGTRPLADFLLRQDAPEEAITVLTEAIQVVPPSSDLIGIYKQLGRLLIDQQEWSWASAVYKELAMVDPVEGAIQLGWLAHEQGRNVDVAAAHFDRAIAAAPRQGIGHYQKARLFALAKRYADADEMYALALEREPRQKAWLIAQANNARNAGDLITAIHRYGEVIRRFPDHAETYHELAEAHRLSGRLEAAIDASQAAIDLSEKPRLPYHLRAARLNESMGKQEKAAELYRIVLTLDRANSTALDALERIKTDD